MKVDSLSIVHRGASLQLSSHVMAVSWAHLLPWTIRPPAGPKVDSFHSGNFTASNQYIVRSLKWGSNVWQFVFLKKKHIRAFPGFYIFPGKILSSRPILHVPTFERTRNIDKCSFKCNNKWNKWLVSLTSIQPHFGDLIRSSGNCGKRLTHVVKGADSSCSA